MIGKHTMTVEPVRDADNSLPQTHGHFAWQTDAPQRHLAMRLPCGHVANLPVEGPRAWQWNGDENKPSLTPSIFCKSKLVKTEQPDGSVERSNGDCWHGYMTEGRLVSV